MYYILGPADDIKNLSEDNELGEFDLNGTFWPGSGYEALKSILNHDLVHELIHQITIIDSSNKQYTIEEFINKLQGHKIKTKK